MLPIDSEDGNLDQRVVKELLNQVDESERVWKVSEVLLGLAQRRPSYNSLDKDLSTVHRSIVEDKDRGMCRGVQYSKVCSNEL